MPVSRFSVPFTSAVTMFGSFTLFISILFTSAMLVFGSSTPNAPSASVSAIAVLESFFSSTLSASTSIVPVSGSSTLSALSTFAILVLRSRSRVFALFMSAVPVSESSAPFASTMSVSGSKFFAPSTFAIPVSRSSALFASVMPLFGSFAAVLVPGSSIFFILAMAWSSLYIPIPRKQRLIELNGRKMKAISKKLAPVYTCQLPSNKQLFLFFFRSSCIDKN